MKKLCIFLILCLLLTCLAACEEVTPTEPQTPVQSTEPPTEPPTDAPTEAPTTEPPVTGPQPMELVGSWQRAYTEVEGDRNENTRATITISGDSETGLIITYKDQDFPDDNFTDKAMTLQSGELYPTCGNSQWYLQADPVDNYTYCLTLLEDGTLLLQCGFDYDGMPMVSYQWFTRIP